MVRSRFNVPIEPMTLDNMRENGVQSRSQCVPAEPAPERRATDLRNYAMFHVFAAQLAERI
jgi:hypothetical protein